MSRTIPAADNESQDVVCKGFSLVFTCDSCDDWSLDGSSFCGPVSLTGSLRIKVVSSQESFSSIVVVMWGINSYIVVSSSHEV